MDQRSAEQQLIYRNKTYYLIKKSNYLKKTHKNKESPFRFSLLQPKSRQVLPVREPSSNPQFHQVTTALGNSGSRHKCYFKTNLVITTEQNQ